MCQTINTRHKNLYHQPHYHRNHLSMVFFFFFCMWAMCYVIYRPCSVFIIWVMFCNLNRKCNFHKSDLLPSSRTQMRLVTLIHSHKHRSEREREKQRRWCDFTRYWRKLYLFNNGSMVFSVYATVCATNGTEWIIAK